MVHHCRWSDCCSFLTRVFVLCLIRPSNWVLCFIFITNCTGIARVGFCKSFAVYRICLGGFFAAGSKWDVIYSGSQREHVCDHLKPGTSYRMRVHCVSRGGESQVRARRTNLLQKAVLVCFTAMFASTLKCCVLLPGFWCSDCYNISCSPGALSCSVPGRQGEAQGDRIAVG